MRKLKTLVATAAVLFAVAHPANSNGIRQCIADDLRLLDVAESAMFEAIAIDRVRIAEGGDAAESFERVRDATVLALMDFLESADKLGLHIRDTCNG